MDPRIPKEVAIMQHAAKAALALVLAAAWPGSARAAPPVRLGAASFA
jgi:hypothetical protein